MAKRNSQSTTVLASHPSGRRGRQAMPRRYESLNSVSKARLYNFENILAVTNGGIDFASGIASANGVGNLDGLPWRSPRPPELCMNWRLEIKQSGEEKIYKNRIGNLLLACSLALRSRAASVAFGVSNDRP